jgi:membrane fusion protein (multidrug efflux system)
MWVYFNVTESQYLDYMAKLVHGNEIEPEKGQVELMLANGTKFPQSASLVRKEGQFNNETGNMAFRADFPNPDGLLRHGQTGTLLIHQKMKNALLIPVRSTFETLDKLYVYVVDKDDVVHQREIVVSKNEMDDIFLIKSGLYVDDKIILEGVRQVHEGDKLKEYEFRSPQEVLANQKNRAE